MAKHQALEKALRQMAEGSRSAFHTFYLGSSLYVYSSALLLYDVHEDACRFMVDFYQYLYLHLPEYDRSTDLETWISRLLVERYEQLSIGKNMTKPSMKKQMDSASAQLSKSEQERIWHMLDVRIHFPKDTVRRSPLRLVLFASVLLLLLLLAYRYLPTVFSKLHQTVPADAVSGPDDPSAEDTENGETQSEDELNAIKDELDDLLTQSGSDSEASDKESGSTDNSNGLQIQQQSGTGDGSIETKTPSAPQTPDTPQEPETPQTPSLSDDFDTNSNIDSLEDLELQLHYGDGLINAGSD